MTLYFLPGNLAVISEDFPAINVDGKYLFCGVTWKDRSYTPNKIPWCGYYTLQPGEGVALYPTSVAYFVGGKKLASVNHDWGNRYDFVTPFPHREIDGEIDQGFIVRQHGTNYWYKTKGYLSSIFATNKNAEKIWRSMQRWESTSMRTMKWLSNEMEGSYLVPDQTEVLISGTYWLIYNYYENRFTIGDLGTVWGSVYLPLERQKIRLATPVKGGWVVKAAQNDWLLQYGNDRTVELLEIVCPAGNWIKKGPWVHWYEDHVILTPLRRLLVTPRKINNIDQATSRWAFSSIRDRELTVISQEGEIFKEKMPEQYGDRVKLFAGDSDVLIKHCKGEYEYISMIPNFDLPFPHCSWETAAFSSQASTHIGVIRGNPDIFVIVFQPSAGSGVGICLINARGEAWWLPYLLPDKSRLNLYVDFMSKGKNQIVVLLSTEERKTTRIKIRVLNNSVQLDTGEGTVITGNMTRLPLKQKDALLQALKPIT